MPRTIHMQGDEAILDERTRVEGDIAWLQEQRAWEAAGRPDLSPIEVMRQAMMVSYRGGGPLAAAVYARELAPYTSPKLSAVAQVDARDMSRLSNEDLLAKLERAVTPAPLPPPGKE